ncbi:hypothetical protein BCR34DRAFT_575527 [Clohesyomyces aquaticus]|uniref:Short-chain dehydrogenase/reductase 3 n=1 Tax=Clohesyomyces aquaticus TaxID=1231657 RepID=A0A1Y1YRC5_9PLEO|nr:hypothetical protein BCR34DRAFT_575527 [Clohesyomyces aquaticus]
MPIRSEWTLAREGVTADTIKTFLSRTILNPAFTLPLYLLGRYTQQGAAIANDNAAIFKHLKTLLYLGLAAKASSYLDSGVTNNWTSDTYDWKKEIVVVTGGSDGIGKIIAHLFAEMGVKVAVMDVQPLTYEAPPTVQYFHVDLASHTSIRSACSSVRSTLGSPTVLINNAGCARGKSILDSTEKDIRLTFNVNTLSHYFLAQQFLPDMIAKNHGTIVTVASLAAYVTAPSMVDYAASKAAALAFHEGLSAELATLYKAGKVRTIVMCQGYTRTALFEGFDPQGALYPETVAEAIVKAVLKGRSDHLVTPSAGMSIPTGLRAFPAWMQYGLRKRLVKLMKGWKGRQVQQPSLSDEKEKEKLGESVVLVET